jgi:hypothetical protein
MLFFKAPCESASRLTPLLHVYDRYNLDPLRMDWR